MTGDPLRLLCIDLQVDASQDVDPPPAAMDAACALLATGRRLGWTIAHTRRRTRPVIRARRGSPAPGVNPLMSEQVFFHDGRSVAGACGLSRLLERWRGQEVAVAAFDPLALISCVLACEAPGPRLLLVEDVMPIQALDSLAGIGVFHGRGVRGTFTATRLSKLVRDAALATGIHVLPAPNSGLRGH
jgi:hypothetical protein